MEHCIWISAIAIKFQINLMYLGSDVSLLHDRWINKFTWGLKIDWWGHVCPRFSDRFN